MLFITAMQWTFKCHCRCVAVTPWLTQNIAKRRWLIYHATGLNQNHKTMNTDAFIAALTFARTGDKVITRAVFPDPDVDGCYVPVSEWTDDMKRPLDALCFGSRVDWAYVDDEHGKRVIFE